MDERITFKCGECDKTHVGLPAFTYRRPAHYVALSKLERAKARASDDLCVIDDEHFFVRAVLKVPIIGKTTAFEWGVWGTLSHGNFKRYQDTYDDVDQSGLGAMFSWMANRLHGYPDTLGLRCNLIPRDNGERPLIEPQSGQDHPLVRDRSAGITLERAIALIMPVLHPSAITH